MMSFLGLLLSLLVGHMALIGMTFFQNPLPDLLGLVAVLVFSIYAATVFALRCGEQSIGRSGQ